ncbi:MAG: hypothetical protein ABI763_09075 [Bacteroidota bacterium]
MSLFFFLLAIFLAGEVIVNPFTDTDRVKPFYTRVFTRLTAGTIVCSLLYSIVFTNFKTVNTGFIVLFFIFLFFQLRSQQKIKFNSENFLIRKEWKRVMVFLFLSALVFLSWELAGFVKGGAFHFSVAGMKDFVYYANVSHYIRQTGEENLYASANFISSDYAGTSPYHYFELWLTDMAGALFCLSPLSTLMLVIYPLFYVILYAGILSVLEIYREQSFMLKLLGLLLLFCSGVFFDVYSRFPLLGQSKAYAIVPFFYFKKLCIYYVFIIAAFLALHYRKPMLFFCCLLCMPLVSFDCGFGIAGACAALLVLNPWLKIFSRKEMKQVIVLFFFVFAFIAIFYSLTGNKKILSGDLQGVIGVSTLFQKENLVKYFNIIAVTSVLFLIPFLPFLPSLWFIRIKKKNYRDSAIFKIIISGLLAMLFSLFAWAVLYRTLNSYQVFKNIALSFANLFVVFILAKILFDPVYVTRRRTLQGKLIICLLLFLPLMGLSTFIRSKIFYVQHPRPNEYSDRYLVQTTGYLSEHPECSRGAAIITPDYYTRFEVPHPISTSLGDYLSLTTNPVMTTDMGLFGINTEGKNQLANVRLKEVVAQSPFCRFVEEQKSNSRFITIEQSQVDFISEKKIRFIVVSGGMKLPDLLKDKIALNYVDDLSGEQFYIFKD